MLRKVASVLLHLSMLALVCSIAAYWAIRILTPAPSSMPPPQAAAALREADPNLAARMFGLVQAAPAVRQALNVQALGAYAAGRDSAAVLVVDGKPARVYLINQEVASGATLVEVRKDSVTIEQAGVRREIALPPQPALGLGGDPPPPGYSREGGTLTAPSVAGAAQPAVASPRPLPPRQPVIPQPMPQLPPVQPPAPPPQSQVQPEVVQPEQAEAASEDSNEGGLRRQARSRALAR